MIRFQFLRNFQVLQAVRTESQRHEGVRVIRIFRKWSVDQYRTASSCIHHHCISSAFQDPCAILCWPLLILTAFLNLCHREVDTLAKCYILPAQLNFPVASASPRRRCWDQLSGPPCLTCPWRLMRACPTIAKCGRSTSVFSLEKRRTVKGVARSQTKSFVIFPQWEAIGMTSKCIRRRGCMTMYLLWCHFPNCKIRLT